MLLRAAHEFGVELPRSFMVGDRWRDIDCGHAAGCATIFIEYNYAEELRQQPDYRVRSLQEAADLILGLGEQPPIFSGGKSTEF
jgi:D-glycero-D-manno-heptose 1,7-bisphosphate phosphatase